MPFTRRANVEEVAQEARKKNNNITTCNDCKMEIYFNFFFIPSARLYASEWSSIRYFCYPLTIHPLRFIHRIFMLFFFSLYPYSFTIKSIEIMPTLCEAVIYFFSRYRRSFSAQRVLYICSVKHFQLA